MDGSSGIPSMMMHEKRRACMSTFWNFTRDDATGNGTIQLDGEIVTENDWWGSGGQVVARNFRNKLASCKDVTVYINSPGGDVFAGAELYTALREHTQGKVTVKVTGIAASAASLVAMAGDEVLMSPVAYMMIHNPWSMATGNSTDHRKEADVLDEITEGLLAAYTAKTGRSRDEIAAMLDAETYMSAQKCVDLGFADGILYQEDDEDDEEKKPQPAASVLMQGKQHGRAAALARVQPSLAELNRRAEIIRRAKIIGETIQ